MNKFYNLTITSLFITLVLCTNPKVESPKPVHYIERVGCIPDSFGDCCESPFQVWQDSDNDGLGNPEIEALACINYSGWVTNNGDLDDNCFSNNLDCNDNCDGNWQLDTFGDCCSELSTFFQDLDGDGLGNPNVTIESCYLHDGWAYDPNDPADNCFSNIKDCNGVCDGLAQLDLCGVCDANFENDNETCTGCMDETAINYDPDAIIDGENCVYPGKHIWHVTIAGSDSTGTGTIDNPFATVNHTIGVAAEHDTILVHTGEFHENINYDGMNLLICSMFYFTGDTSFISQTILNGDAIGSVVTFENGEDSTAILAGFTITNGLGEINSGTYYGGGITVINNSNPLLTNLVITDNIALRGGGLKIHYSSPTIQNSVISYNSASGDSFSHGGGVHSNHSDVIINNVDIIGNTAGYNSGGFYNNHGTPNLTDVRIRSNSTVNDGGGIGCGISSARLENCIISDNVAGNLGGGIVFWYGADMELDQVIFYNNYAQGGGAIESTSSAPILSNVTITNNNSDNGNDISVHNSPDLVFINSIIWDNITTSLLLDVNIEYCDIYGVGGYGTNISVDPMFVNPTEFDYSLSMESPCIDAGIDNFENDIISFHMNSDDYFGFRPDLGAFETEYSNNLIGDVNQDNIIDILDLVIIIDYVLNEINLSDFELWLCDLNHDGIVDILDIVILIGMILGN
ncbi:MAG: hypothetical protein HQ510_04555 [Candidatus Marinimicrobia bacterium]|nr:hypothetical protein [Candidatus Neomarinimicrobiota bacterium]